MKLDAREFNREHLFWALDSMDYENREVVLEFLGQSISDEYSQYLYVTYK